MTVRVIHGITLLCVALVAGLTLTHVLQSPGSRGLSGPEWLTVQHSFYGGFAVVGGIAEVLGLITSVVLAVLLRGHRRAAAGPLVTALCLAGTLLAFALGNQPVNQMVATWSPATLPADWPTYRDQWETAHAVSAALSLIALVTSIVAAGPVQHLTRARGYRGERVEARDEER